MCTNAFQCVLACTSASASRGRTSPIADQSRDSPGTVLGNKCKIEDTSVSQDSSGTLSSYPQLSCPCDLKYTSVCANLYECVLMCTIVYHCVPIRGRTQRNKQLRIITLRIRRYIKNAIERVLEFHLCFVRVPAAESNDQSEAERKEKRAPNHHFTFPPLHRKRIKEIRTHYGKCP